jgi:hypothetical protein
MCGCKGNASRGRSFNGGIRRNLIPAAANTPQPVLNAQQSSTVTRLNASGLSAERRKTQAIRRNAIRNALNK